MDSKIIIGGALLAGFFIYKSSSSSPSSPQNSEVDEDYGDTREIQMKERMYQVSDLDKETRDLLYQHILEHKKSDNSSTVAFIIGVTIISVSIGVVLLIKKLHEISSALKYGIENPYGEGYKKEIKKQIDDIPGDSNLDKLKKYAKDKIDNIGEKMKNLKESTKEKISDFVPFMDMGGSTRVKWVNPKQESPFEEDPPQQKSIETSNISKTDQEILLKQEIEDLPQDTLNKSDVIVKNPTEVSTKAPRHRKLMKKVPKKEVPKKKLPLTNEFPQNIVTEVDVRVIKITESTEEIIKKMKTIIVLLQQIRNQVNYNSQIILNPKDSEDQQISDFFKFIKNTIHNFSKYTEQKENLTNEEITKFTEAYKEKVINIESGAVDIILYKIDINKFNEIIDEISIKIDDL